MKYPSPKKLAEMDKKLSKLDGVKSLPKNATYSQEIKHDMCKYIIAYARSHHITQVELAKKLGIDPARISEIAQYKIDKFTIDTLLTYNRMLDSKFELKIKHTA